MEEYISNNEQETFDIAFEFAKRLKVGTIISLNGDLGAGKTVFTKGICKYFNVKEYVNSPTYTLVNEYHGDIDIFHFDLYRLSDEEELYNLGFLDYINDSSIAILEWANKFPEAFLGFDIIDIEIKKDSRISDKRRIYIKC